MKNQLPIGLSQEATPKSEWPYEQDWIVSSYGRHWQGGYYISGENLNYKPNECSRHFYWRFSHSDWQGLDWRYDLTNAEYINKEG